MKTTVVVPVWDAYAGKVLDLALQSLAQQKTPFMLLIVDNASTVPLPDIADVQTVRSPTRLTVGSARNLGLAHVQTRYVIFWDADDEMLPGTLERLEREMEANPSLVAFGMAIREEPSGQRHRWPRRYLSRLARFPVVLRMVEAVWAQFPTTGATIIRTDAAKAGGGYADADSGEDWCLGVSLAFRGRIGWTEDPGRVYRLHPESMWARHLTVSHQRRHAQAIRQRIREDSGVPRWVKRTLPVIRLGQEAALAAHAGVSAVRKRRAGSD